MLKNISGTMVVQYVIRQKYVPGVTLDMLLGTTVIMVDAVVQNVIVI